MTQLEEDLISKLTRDQRAPKASALGQPRGMGWGGRRRGVEDLEKRVYPWLIHVSEWQKPLQYFKVISVQLK